MDVLTCFKLSCAEVLAVAGSASEKADRGLPCGIMGDAWPMGLWPALVITTAPSPPDVSCDSRFGLGRAAGGRPKFGMGDITEGLLTPC